MCDDSFHGGTRSKTMDKMVATSAPGARSPPFVVVVVSGGTYRHPRGWLHFLGCLGITAVAGHGMRVFEFKDITDSSPSVTIAAQGGGGGEGDVGGGGGTSPSGFWNVLSTISWVLPFGCSGWTA